MWRLIYTNFRFFIDFVKLHKINVNLFVIVTIIIKIKLCFNFWCNNSIWRVEFAKKCDSKCRTLMSNTNVLKFILKIFDINEFAWKQVNCFTKNYESKCRICYFERFQFFEITNVWWDLFFFEYLWWKSTMT